MNPRMPVHDGFLRRSVMIDGVVLDHLHSPVRLATMTYMMARSVRDRLVQMVMHATVCTGRRTPTPTSRQTVRVAIILSFADEIAIRFLDAQGFRSGVPQKGRPVGPQAPPPAAETVQVVELEELHRFATTAASASAGVLKGRRSLPAVCLRLGQPSD